MKNLVRIFLCLVAAVVTAMAQQNGESKSSSQVLPPGGQPAAEALVRALLAADTAQNKQERLPVEELKKLVEREIAKSAALPLVTSTKAPVTQGLKGESPDTVTIKTGMIVIEGAVYIRFGDTIYPMVGGGASGCFDPDAEARVQKARQKFAGQLKTEQEKAEQEKKG